MGKQLKIVADDFGYGFARNHGIVDCFQRHAISAVSLLVNCKHSLHAVDLSKMHDIPTGLHFNITEGFPISHPQTIPSLVTASGNFMGREAFWNNPKLIPWHVEEELLAQIEWFKRAFDKVPAHVDGHQHVHIHPKVVKVFSNVLRNYGIKYTRLPLEDKVSPADEDLLPQRKQFHIFINSVANRAGKVFEGCNINITQTFIGLNFMGTAMTIEKLQQVLRSIYGCGITSCEMMVHPGYRCNRYTDGFAGDDMSDFFSCSLDREHEMNVLRSEEMLKFYNDEGIALSYY